MSSFFKTIFASEQDVSESTAYSTGFYGSLFFVLVSAVLTALNIAKGYVPMAIATGVLIVGFVASALLARRRAFRPSRAIMAVLCGVIFSLFAVTGSNEGFAILWILLVPIIGMMLIGLRAGFLLSLYFQVFLIALFYTPLASVVAGCYTDTFSMRFPLLYFASFGAITFLMVQRQRLFDKVNHQASYDSLTGMLNRRSFDEARSADDANPDPELTVVVLDLNRLKHVNDTIGHEAGDEIIAAMGGLTKQAFASDRCFRTGGDEFSVVSVRKDVARSIEDFDRAISAWHGKLVQSVSASVGYASRADHPGASFSDLVKLADTMMYADKASFYRDSSLDRRGA